MEAQSHQLVQARQLSNALFGILKGLYLSSLLVLGYLYLHFVLFLYPWTRPLAARLLAILLSPLQTMGMGLIDSLPGIVFVAVVVIVTRYVLRLTRLYFDSVDRGTVTLARFDREWALPTYRIARLIIIAFAAVVAYPYIPGSNSEAFKGVSIFLGLMVSLGSSSVIGNMMAGYTMIYRRAFKVGDRISVDNVIGDVTERRLMVTHLRTIKNEEIVVPNSTIINSNIMNYSTLARSRGLILHTTVGIGYETPWRQVEAMLLSRRRAHSGAAQGARAIRAAEVAGRLRRDLRTECLLRRSARHGAALYRDAPKYPRCFQRARRADHDAGLRGRPGSAQGGTQGPMVSGAGQRSAKILNQVALPPRELRRANVECRG